MSAQKSKLIRNLKPGDKIRISIPDENRSAIVEISRVQETRSGFLTKRRMWEAIIKDAPFWWFPGTVTGYSDSRISVIS